MIKNYFVTGDTHGKVMDRLLYINTEPSETAVIILGDVGFNFYLNKTDYINKKNVNNSGYTIYAVRGNHEERPETLDIPVVYDDVVCGYVYREPQFPNINYFIDGNEYTINGYSVLVIGGAYSVDKWYRLSHCDPNAKWTGWFEDEQLNQTEMNEIFQKVKGKNYDFIFSHTCPIAWEPTELFLAAVDQSTVDRTMELWLDEVRENISWNYAWCFGHYHADMLVRPHVEMYYYSVENLDNLAKRWSKEQLDEWWLRKSRDYYM